jgi:hypothetical protein
VRREQALDLAAQPLVARAGLREEGGAPPRRVRRGGVEDLLDPLPSLRIHKRGRAVKVDGGHFTREP